MTTHEDDHGPRTIASSHVALQLHLPVGVLRVNQAQLVLADALEVAGQRHPVVGRTGLLAQHHDPPGQPVRLSPSPGAQRLDQPVTRHPKANPFSVFVISVPFPSGRPVRVVPVAVAARRGHTGARRGGCPGCGRPRRVGTGTRRER